MPRVSSGLAPTCERVLRSTEVSRETSSYEGLLRQNRRRSTATPVHPVAFYVTSFCAVTRQIKLQTFQRELQMLRTAARDPARNGSAKTAALVVGWVGIARCSFR